MSDAVNQSPGMNDCPFCGEALRALAEMFTESVHETWTREEVVNIIEDAIRMGSPLAAPAPSAWQPERLPTHGNLLADINKAAHAAGTNAWVRDVLQRAHRAIRQNAPLALPSSDRGGVWVHRTTESAEAPIGQQKARDAAP